MNVTVEEGISDHRVVCSELDISVVNHTTHLRKVYFFKTANFEGFRSKLKAEYPLFIESTLNADTEQIWNAFLDIMNNGLYHFTPSKSKKQNNEPMWYTKEVRAALRKQRQYHSKLKKLHTNATKEQREYLTMKYREIRAKCKRVMRISLKEYKKKILCEQLHENPKSFCFFLREVHGKRPTVRTLINDKGEFINESKEKGDLLNKFFESVFTKGSGELHDDVSYTTSHYNMPDIEITTAGIARQLQIIKPHKSPGPENIPAKVLKEMAIEIAPYLTNIFAK